MKLKKEIVEAVTIPVNDYNLSCINQYLTSIDYATANLLVQANSAEYSYLLHIYKSKDMGPLHLGKHWWPKKLSNDPLNN